eukprot:384880-Rhodomonas_salina.3
MTAHATTRVARRRVATWRQCSATVTVTWLSFFSSAVPQQVGERVSRRAGNRAQDRQHGDCAETH